MTNVILRPSTPPAALILLASISAPYRAGSSVGAISALKSIAAPITIGLPPDDDDEPLVELELAPELAELALLVLLLLLDPHAATITAAAATSASAVTEPLNFLMSGSPPGLKRQRAAPTAGWAVLCAVWKCGITRSANISWVLIAFQCSKPPGLTVIAISLRPSHTSIVCSIRSITSCGVPTHTMSPSIISS